MARRPFFSGNYRLGSNANAANLIAQAGAAQGQMFQNLGSQIGGMIQQYGLNKEKQKRNEGFIKSQSSMLDMLAEQDPDMASQYAAYKENLNNPDVPLSTRVEFGKNLVNNITISNQIKGQRLIQATQAQSLKEQKDTEKLRNDLLVQKKAFNDLGMELKQLEVDEGEALSAAKIQNILARYGLSGEEIEAERKLLPKKTEALGTQLEAESMRNEIDLADAKNLGGPVGVAKKREEDRELGRKNIESLIRSRDFGTAASLYKLMNIGVEVPQDLEKRFSDIASQIDKVDNSQIKVRNKDGDEVMVSLKEYQSKVDEFAPLVSDRVKALISKKDALIEEQTNVTLGIKIPYTDPDTGEIKYTTVAEKLSYEEARKEILQQRQKDKIEKNKAELPFSLYNMPKVPVMNY